MQLFASSEIAILVSDADLEVRGELRIQQPCGAALLECGLESELAARLELECYWKLELQPDGIGGKEGLFT